MSVPAYAAYRESGVEWIGLVPTTWRISRVSAVADVLNGFPFDADQFDPEVGLPLVRIRDLNARETAVRFAGEPVSTALITSDDLLIGMDGDFNVGRWLGEGAALLNQRMCCLRGKSLLIRWLEYALPTPLRRINEVTYSTTVKHLSSGQIRNVRIALPPNDEELAAALTFLDRECGKIDGLVAEQERLIALLKEKRQAVISEAVIKGLDPTAPTKPSGITWLSTIPAHWSIVALRRVVQSGRRITYGIVQPGEPDETGRFMVRGQDYSAGWTDPSNIFRVSDHVEEPYQRARLATNDIVMTIVGAGVGNVAIVPAWLDGANITQTTARIAIDRIVALPEYVAGVLTGPVGRRSVEAYAKGAAQPGLNLEHVKLFPIPLPPLAEQREIVTYVHRAVSVLEGLADEAERAIALLHERRAALISAAVTGKIDVRGLVAVPEHVAA